MARSADLSLGPLALGGVAAESITEPSALIAGTAEPPRASGSRRILSAPVLSVLLHAGIVGALILVGRWGEDLPPALLTPEVTLVSMAMDVASSAPPAVAEPAVATAAPAPVSSTSTAATGAAAPAVVAPRKAVRSPRPSSPARDAAPSPIAADTAAPAMPAAPSPALGGDEGATDAPPQASAPAAPGKASSAPQYEFGAEDMPVPSYPATARRRGRQGTVLIRLEVSAEGRPERIDIVESSGDAALDEAAATTLGHWRLRPATHNGVPVRGSVLVPVVFKLQ